MRKAMSCCFCVRTCSVARLLEIPSEVPSLRTTFLKPQSAAIQGRGMSRITMDLYLFGKFTDLLVGSPVSLLALCWAVLGTAFSTSLERRSNFRLWSIASDTSICYVDLHITDGGIIGIKWRVKFHGRNSWVEGSADLKRLNCLQSKSFVFWQVDDHLLLSVSQPSLSLVPGFTRRSPPSPSRTFPRISLIAVCMY